MAIPQKCIQIICNFNFLSVIIYLLCSFLYCGYLPNSTPQFMLLMRKIHSKKSFLCMGGSGRLIIFPLHCQITQVPTFNVFLPFKFNIKLCSSCLNFFLFVPHFIIVIILAQALLFHLLNVTLLCKMYSFNKHLLFTYFVLGICNQEFTLYW